MKSSIRDLLHFARPVRKNLFISLFDKVVRLFLNFFLLSKLLAELGPETLGKLSYVQALAGLFMTVSALGLDSVLVRSFSKADTNDRQHLSALVNLRILTGLLLAMAFALVLWLMKGRGDEVYLLMLGFAAAGLATRFFDPYRPFMEARVQLFRIVVVELTVFLFFLFLKVLAVFYWHSLALFVGATLLEATAASIGVYFFRSSEAPSYSPRAWVPSYFRDVLKQGLPILLSALAIWAYMRLGIFLVEAFNGAAELGQYSAAVRLSEFLYFVPAALMAALNPLLLSKDKTDSDFERDLERLLGAGLYGAIAVGLVFQFLSEDLIGFLYGPEFAASAAVLKVHIWALIPVVLGTIQSSYFLRRNITQLQLGCTLMGAIANIAFGLWLIPSQGAVGAAWVVLISYFVSAIIANAVFETTRPLLWMQLRSPFSFYRGR